MLKPVDENLWIYEEAASRLGFEFGARMTIVRLQDESLLLHSPLAISPELKNEIDALGEVRFVVSPFRFHFLHLGDCFRVYPGAQFYAPPGMNTAKFPEVRFAGFLRETEAQWQNDLDQTIVRGNALDNEVVFFHRASRTLICADLCFNLPSSRPPWTRFIARVLGVYRRFSPSLEFKLFTRNRTLVRQSIDRILAWDFERIIISHGDIIESGGKETLRAAFAWLRR